MDHEKITSKFWIVPIISVAIIAPLSCGTDEPDYEVRGSRYYDEEDREDAPSYNEEARETNASRREEARESRHSGESREDYNEFRESRREAY